MAKRRQRAKLERRIADALRVPAGPIDLRTIDPGSTPELDGGKKDPADVDEQRARLLGGP